jgi:hypothetical protein
MLTYDRDREKISGQATQFNIRTIQYVPWTESQLNLR